MNMKCGKSIWTRAFCIGSAVFSCVASAHQRPTIGQLNEVVVTATKRTQNLQDVPGSVTALSANALHNQGVTDFTEYMTLVPSLSDFSGGSEGHGAVILRGLNTGYFQTSNTVGFYIDGIPFSATSPLSVGTLLTPDPDLSDIKRIEVLRGPQATLYGASALGGLIKIVTRKPDLSEYSGELRTSASSVDHGSSGYGVLGIANLPIIPGKMAVRFDVFDRDTPGYMTNVALGTRDRGVSRKQGGRIALRWAPAGDLDLQLNVLLQSLSQDGWNYEFVDLKTLRPISGPYTYATTIEPKFHTTYEVYNFTAKYKVGSIGTLTNSASYASYRDHEIEDFSPFYGFLNAYAPVPAPNNAVQPLFFGPTLDKLTDELRFAARRIGAMEWLEGLFFTREQVNYPVRLTNIVPPSLAPIPGPDGLLIGVNSPSTYKEEAAYADVTYYFNDAWNLTLGGRYSHNQQTVNASNLGFANSGLTILGSTSGADFSYLGALRWKPAPGVNTYVQVASAYRPGGPELNPQPGYRSFKPDSLVNYETGVKADWFRRRLRTNLDVYYMDWKDVQMSFLDSGLDVISNGGKATSKGVEFEAEALPVNRLRLRLSVAYTDAKLNEVSAGITQATGAVAGNSLPYTPKWSGSLTADYAQPISSQAALTLGATLGYQGTKWSDYPGDPNNTGVLIPAYRTVDLRTGVDWQRYSVQLRVANVFNERGLDTVLDQRIVPGSDVPAWAAIIPPRTITVSLAARF